MPTENRLNSKREGFCDPGKARAVVRNLEARLSRHEGIVLLAVVVNEAGCAMEVKVLRSSGDVELDRAAVVTVTRWTFQPATAGGRR